MTCFFWYGGRAVYFYLDSKKIDSEKEKNFVSTIKQTNKNNIKLINKEYFFYGKEINNYVDYSNLTWRIVKIKKDNSVVLITENIISSLPYSSEKSQYDNSIIINWLNKNESNASGTFENYLNNKNSYIEKDTVCTDAIDKIDKKTKITCQEKSKKHYINLPSLNDYINTGGKNSFMNNERNFPLSNQNKENEIYYVTNENKLSTTSYDEFIGIKATITLKPNLAIKDGDGTKDNPYKFETSTGKLGSYVKLDNDIWRIYEEKGEIVKLILQDTLNDSNSNEKLTHIYSTNGYYHNDTVKGSLAYYLNHTYLYTLKYKDIIIENSYNNSIFSTNNNFDYSSIINNTIPTKVALPSIGDIILNDTLNNYFLSTGISKNSTIIYIQNEKGQIKTNNSNKEANVVPCISIKYSNLTKGSGTKNDPYRMED